MRSGIMTPQLLFEYILSVGLAVIVLTVIAAFLGFFDRE